MIPKVIHYCWFGNNPLPEMAKKCINSWEKFLPDYEIKEWNESNFDVNCCRYVKEAYDEKKWAFVSDYARFLILYNEGGIYFDTDVEIVSPMESVIENGNFMGSEKVDENDLNYAIAINPGLGLGAEKGLLLYKEILEEYNKRSFYKADGTINPITVVEFITEIMMKRGWESQDSTQTVEDIVIYKPEYFGAMDYQTGKIELTKNTKSIHHYAASWFNDIQIKMLNRTRKCINIFGKKRGKKIANIINLPLKLNDKIKSIGLRKTCSLVIKKIVKRKV